MFSLTDKLDECKANAALTKESYDIQVKTCAEEIRKCEIINNDRKIREQQLNSMNTDLKQQLDALVKNKYILENQKHILENQKTELTHTNSILEEEINQLKTLIKSELDISIKNLGIKGINTYDDKLKSDEENKHAIFKQIDTLITKANTYINIQQETTDHFLEQLTILKAKIDSKLWIISADINDPQNYDKIIDLKNNETYYRKDTSTTPPKFIIGKLRIDSLTESHEHNDGTLPESWTKVTYYFTDDGNKQEILLGSRPVTMYKLKKDFQFLNEKELEQCYDHSQKKVINTAGGYKRHKSYKQHKNIRRKSKYNRK